MSLTRLSALEVMSLAWYESKNKSFLHRATKAVFEGLKSTVSKYDVRENMMNKRLLKIAGNHRNSLVAKKLDKYQINIVKNCSNVSDYVKNKVSKLREEGRQVELVPCFKKGDAYKSYIPMYDSHNTFQGDFNKEAVVKDNEGISQTVVCRHLSKLQINSDNFKGKEAYKKINSKDKIFNHFNNDKKGLEFISGDERFKETIYATQDQLLTALTDEIKNNWSMPIEDDRRYFLINEDHVMTIRLKKQDDCMKVIYYDPNKTAQHTTFLISNPEQMTHFPIDKMIKDYPSITWALVNAKSSNYIPVEEQSDLRYYGESDRFFMLEFTLNQKSPFELTTEEMSLLMEMKKKSKS